MEDFWRVSWSDTNGIDDDEDSDAEFVKAKATCIFIPDKPEFCKHACSQILENILSKMTALEITSSGRWCARNVNIIVTANSTTATEEQTENAIGFGNDCIFWKRFFF